MKITKLRLIVTPWCNRKCIGCCNKGWNLHNLPVASSYSEYEEVLLTGGEPMLQPDVTLDIIKEIRGKTKARIYMYTAKVDNLRGILNAIDILDGVCVTLHEQKDVAPFNQMQQQVLKYNARWFSHKSLRLNVFAGIKHGGPPASGWVARRRLKWRKDCPLPDGEVLMRHQDAY